MRLLDTGASRPFGLARPHPVRVLDRGRPAAENAGRAGERTGALHTWRSAKQSIGSALHQLRRRRSTLGLMIRPAFTARRFIPRCETITTSAIRDFRTSCAAFLIGGGSDFAHGSIDPLHINGFHTYDAAQDDFEDSAPQLSDRAIVLFHDIDVHERDFGVWRLWDELTQHPSFDFRHHHGLGHGRRACTERRRSCAVRRQRRTAGQDDYSRMLCAAPRRHPGRDHHHRLADQFREELRLAELELGTVAGRDRRPR